MTVVVTVVLLFVAFVFLVLLHVCLYERLSGRRGSIVERGTNGGKSMSINDLEKLPCYDYVAKGNTSSLVDCAVCLESLITGDKCRLLPMCKHSFHAQCVDTWLLKTPICPICRCNAYSHRGNQVVSNNDSFIEPSSGSMESHTTTGIQLHDNLVLVQLRESLENDTENPILGSHNSVREE